MEMTKEVVLLYFRNKAAYQEDSVVENWLKSAPENPKQALKWIDELTDEEEKLFLKIVLSGNDVWEKTVTQIDARHPNSAKHFKGKNANIWLNLLYQHTYRNAAIIVSILMLAFAFYLYRAHSVINVASDSEIKHVALPDGSLAVLNINSHLKYANPRQGNPREVWLEGEAFFRVKPNADQVPFKVHLSGKTSIEARSAEFNVSDVRDNCTVFLKSGEITFHIPNKELPNVNLKPGQVLVLDKETDKVYLEKAGNAEKYHDWIHKK